MVVFDNGRFESIGAVALDCAVSIPYNIEFIDRHADKLLASLRLILRPKHNHWLDLNDLMSAYGDENCLDRLMAE